jgi:hypothetical protein
MTACAYISPNNRANLIADTLVSGQEVSVNTTPLVWMSGQPITPLNGFPVLARKIYFFGKKTAVAFCGNEKTIGSLLAEAEQFEINELDERPMRRLSNLVNDINAKKFEVGLVGATVFQDVTGRWINNKIKPDNVPTILYPCAGLCHFSGSGADELSHLIGLHDEVFQEFAHFLLEDGAAYQEHLLSYIVSKQLRTELDQVPSTNLTWGGFLEHAWFDYEKKKWCLTPSSLHLVFFYHLDSNGIVTVALSKAVAYDAGNTHGKLLVVAPLDKDLGYHVWEIKNLLSKSTPAAQIADTGWRPLQTTVSFVPLPQLKRKKNLFDKSLCQLLDERDASEVSFEFRNSTNGKPASTSILGCEPVIERLVKVIANNGGLTVKGFRFGMAYYSPTSTSHTLPQSP